MRSCLLLYALFTLFLTSFAHANLTFEVPTSFRQPHPMNWLHSTPVGETPGWNNSNWFFFELSNSNIWNAPLTMKNIKTNEVLTYEADYEQVSAIGEVGSQISPNLAFAIEIPFALRSGGFFDQQIEDFHDWMGNRNFSRELYETNRKRFSITTNGKKGYSNASLSEISSLKPKFKWWFKKCENKKSTCGLAVSTQLKLPLQSSRSGGSNEKIEGSTLFHFGLPIFSRLDFWATAGFSRLRRDENMPRWPLLKNHQMYEANFDFSFNEKWGAFLQFRMQSPYLDRNQLEYIDGETSARRRSNNRASTAWNSLVRWQGAEALGFRYRKKQKQFSLAIAEDWGLGNYDAGDHIYSNNAPDLNIIFQYSSGF